MEESNNNNNGDSENGDIGRREFLEKAALASAAAVLPVFAGCKREDVDKMLEKHLLELSPADLTKKFERLEKEVREKYGKDATIDNTPAMKDVLFGYGLDISRCVGCRRCVYACVKENNQSRDPAIHWIRVLEMDKDKGVDLPYSDPYYCSDNSLHSPTKGPVSTEEIAPVLNEGEKNILANPDTQYPLYPIDAKKKLDASCTVPRQGEFYMPVACQQCEDPPCVKVCPVQATWKEPDGITVIDYDWCIGCRYCMAACPYGARHFNWHTPNLPAEEVNPNMHYLGNVPRPKGVVEKCTFCIQRTRKGLYPACVEICPVGARKFGNLLDPKSEIRYIMERKRVFILKNELATHPKFYYFYGV